MQAQETPILNAVNEADPPQPTFEVQFAGKTWRLYFGFKALYEIGLNPFKHDEIQAYIADLNPERMAKLLWAGLTYYQRDVTFEWVFETITLNSWLKMQSTVLKAALYRDPTDEEEASEENPQPAQVG